MLSEVVAGELEIDVSTSTAEDVWQLSTDRRERVLAVLDNRNPSPPENVTLANKRWPKHWRVTTLEAVVVASIACVLIGLMLPAVQSSRVAARRMSYREGTTAEFPSDSALSATRDIGPSKNTLFDGEQMTLPGSPNDFFSQPSNFAEKTRRLEDRTHPTVSLHSHQKQPVPSNATGGSLNLVTNRCQIHIIYRTTFITSLQRSL